MSSNICLGRSARIRDNAQPDIQPRDRTHPEMPCNQDAYLTKPFRHDWRSNLVCASRPRKFRDAAAGKESSPVARYMVAPNNRLHCYWFADRPAGKRQKMGKWYVAPPAGARTD